AMKSFVSAVVLRSDIGRSPATVASSRTTSSISIFSSKAPSGDARAEVYDGFWAVAARLRERVPRGPREPGFDRLRRHWLSNDIRKGTGGDIEKDTTC